MAFGAAGFDVKRRLDLPTFGTIGVEIADLDADGKPDVIFANGTANSFPGNRNSQHVYWGDASGTVSLPNATSDLTTTGTGQIVITTARNMVFGSGSTINTQNGALTLNANQQASPTSGMRRTSSPHASHRMGTSSIQGRCSSCS